MLVGAFIAAVLWAPVSDGDDPDAHAARIRTAKTVYESCIVSHAAQMYHGTADGPLEQAVAKSCGSEKDELLNAITAGATLQAQAATREAVEPRLAAAVHMAVQAAAQAK